MIDCSQLKITPGVHVKVHVPPNTLLKKYRIKFKEKRKIKIKITNEKTNEVFVGTTEQVAKKLWLSETYVLRTARTNGRLLYEWIAKVVEN